MSRGLYAYAITRDRPFDLGGPWAVGHRGLAVVVAEVELELFSGLSFEETTEDSPLAVLARYHDTVVRAVFQHAPVLPLRFGTVLGGVDAAVRLLDVRHAEASAWLDRMDGRREWGVRVRAAARTPLSLDGMSGTAYLAQRRQRLVDVDAAKLGAQTLHEALTERAADSTCRDLAAGLLLEAAYLVDTGAEHDFRADVERLTAELGLTAEITGPWPPYSFTRVEFADA
jgi:hypothetical protein